MTKLPAFVFLGSDSQLAASPDTVRLPLQDDENMNQRKLLVAIFVIDQRVTVCSMPKTRAKVRAKTRTTRTISRAMTRGRS